MVVRLTPLIVWMRLIVSPARCALRMSGSRESATRWASCRHLSSESSAASDSADMYRSVHVPGSAYQALIAQETTCSVQYMSTLDEPIDRLYDDILAVQRRAVDIEREYRALATRDDLAVDTLGADTTPAECIAQVVEALTTMRRALDAAEDARSAAKNAAARLYIDR